MKDVVVSLEAELVKKRLGVEASASLLFPSVVLHPRRENEVRAWVARIEIQAYPARMPSAGAARLGLVCHWRQDAWVA